MTTAIEQVAAPEASKKHYGPDIAVVSVPRSALGTYAGKPWADVLAAASGGALGLKVDRIQHGVTTQQHDRPSWTPPIDGVTKKPFPYLPLNCAWLREIKGRAFLYLQNW